MSMGLRPTHLGYAYQDLLTALRLVDLAVGRAKSVLVDTKMFTGDRFDDITCVWGTGSRERLQIKHTDHDRALSVESFTKDNRGLRLDLLFSSMDHGLTPHPGASHRLVVRDTEPEDPLLTQVLRPVGASTDPGPALHGLSSKRFRFDAAALRAHAPWKELLAATSDDLLHRACASLIVDTTLPACSLNIREPGPAEAALLHRVTVELGAGRPPNRHRTPEEVALALIETAKAARSREGRVLIEDLLPRLGLEVDFGAVREGHPVDRASEVTRPTVLTGVVAAVEGAAQRGGVVVVTGAPGIGKSWLCEQLGDALRETWLAVRHHCWLGAGDVDREQRVLTEVVIGSLVKQLGAAVPEALEQVRPRYAATSETLEAAVAAVRGLAPDRPVVLIVDGIDHVSRVLGSTTGSAFRAQLDPAARLVADLTGLELPPGVVLVLASQPGSHLEAVDVGASRLTVPPLSRVELHALAERLGVLSALASSAAGPGSDPAGEAKAAVALIEERSRGNALYATYLCRQAIGPAPGLGAASAPDGAGDPLERLRAVPSSAHGLDDYYAYLLDGLAPGQRSAVSMLAVCDFAVTAEELEEIFPLPGMQLGAALTNVAPIVAQQPGIGGLKIHHESFSRFIRRIDGDGGWVDKVRSQAADWLSQRGFFTDPRAFRHLPELLAALGRDDELALLIGPDFLSRAIAGLQPPQAIVHTLTVAAWRAAARNDWPMLVRCVELSRAQATYKDESLPGSLVSYGNVLVALLGADRVAASLMYEGVPTMSARWGLQLCEAVDRAGHAAPWEAYLSAWDEARDDKRVHYGPESDESVYLAELRGRIRLPGRAADDAVSEQVPRPLAQRVARFLDQEVLASPERALGVLLDCLGPDPLLESVELIEHPDRRAALLLHLADAHSKTGGALPSARTLATAAWASGPCDPRRLLGHGVAVADVAEEVFSGNIAAVLTAATQEVLTKQAGGLFGPVNRWLTLLAVAHAADPQEPTRLLPQLGGDGFYRAWLRLTIATLGLRHDVETGKITAATASATARVALEQLAQYTAPFAGRPNASDLLDIHRLVRRVLHDVVALLHGDDVALGIASLQAVSKGTTTSLMGMAGTGPLITTELLSLLAASVGRAGADVVHELMRTLRTGHGEQRALYTESADFELEMARVSLACGDLQEAQLCWDRAARYMGAYGSHKDITVEELLNPLPQLMQADPVQARVRLAHAQPLVYLVAHSTDGRGTGGFPTDWWQWLASLDPQAAAQLGAQVLLTEPGLPDDRVTAAVRRLLATQADTADPVVLAALRIAAGSAGRSIEGDIALLGRLADLPADDAARSLGLLPVLANAVTSTYDDQTLIATSHGDEHEPNHALRSAAQRCGGEGGPPWAPRPVPVTTSRDWSGRESRPATHAYLHAQQRPMLPAGVAGVLAAVRDRSGKAYDAPQGPRWSRDALANAVGWRLLELLDCQGVDAVIPVLHRIADEMNLSNPLDLLADISAGFQLRRDVAPDSFGELAATAGMLAYTRTRGGGGWRAFAGSDRLDLWQQAHAADATAAAHNLAEQVAQAVAHPSHSSTIGVSQALVSAFAIQSPDPAQPSSASALACWDAAYDVIAHRLPGDARLGQGAYHPVPEAATQHDIDTALCRLAVAAIALPERGDKRRALIAATVLLASRPGQAQASLAHVLSFDLGAGPLAWLLSVLHSHLPDGPVDAALCEQLEVLCDKDMLSVRAEASAILIRAGQRPPSPAATAAHPTLARAIAAALSRTEGGV
ncbi:ATP-binding protein [Streptomyces sp. wa1063]|uniref:AAA family ATPase n=1 Tax=Streptomyces sp. wa1063 TaxID=1828212 RepID=UPI00117E80FF|nr:ATP-binding protein [Streptomyces sp. wa1063]